MDPNADPGEAYPFLPVFELLNQAIRDGDRATVTRTLLAIRARWREWLTGVPDIARRAVVIAIRENFLTEVAELIQRHGVPSLHKVYVPEIVALAGDTHDLQAALLPEVAHVNRTLIGLILAGEDEAAAPGVAALFGLEERVQADHEAAIQVHQVLGSIGQAVGTLLPASLGYEFETHGFGRMDDSRSDVVAELRHGYSELCDRREVLRERDDAYIWLEAIEVTAAALLQRGVETGSYHAISEHVQDLILDLVPTTRALAYEGGSQFGLRGAIWALARLSRMGMDPTGAEQIWACLADLIVEAGQAAHDLDLDWFDGDKAADHAVEALGNVPMQFWEHAITEAQMHRINEKPSHDSRWEFTKKAGAQLGTNFGFMFDATTGEDYAKDDPRRR